MIDLTKERADIQNTYLHLPDSGCVSDYELREGLLVVPIMGEPTDTPIVGRVHAPYTVRRSSFSYAKGASPPYIPSPGNTRTGHTFLGGLLGIIAPGTSGEGTLNFGARGTYDFVLPQHATVTGKIMFDAHPYPSGVDMLEASPSLSKNPSDPDNGQFYNTWTGQYFDLALFTSFRILG